MPGLSLNLAKVVLSAMNMPDLFSQLVLLEKALLEHKLFYEDQDSVIPKSGIPFSGRKILSILELRSDKQEFWL